MIHSHSFWKSASISFAGCDYWLRIWIPGILLGLLSELLLKKLPKIHREKGRYSISANAEYQLNHSIVIQNLAKSFFLVSFCFFVFYWKHQWQLEYQLESIELTPAHRAEAPTAQGSGLPPSGGWHCNMFWDRAWWAGINFPTCINIAHCSWTFLADNSALAT